jgi:hypothetical protein
VTDKKDGPWLAYFSVFAPALNALNERPRERNPMTPNERLRLWLLAKLHRHKWQAYTLEGGASVYSCRRCACGADQFIENGLCGDGQWHDIATYQWRYDWERENFLRAKETL